ncbi:MAG: hypothetical protein IJP26_01380 [Clostridia bacterium]|nr:hypothetical protein [Clostridia bacterium]
MALGFRKSLFGYNCDDVAEYLQKQAIKNTQIQTELNTKIKEGNQKIEESEKQIENLKSENSELLEKVEFYSAKYEEVKELSDNIGKLYLVAQTNAKAIMNAADTAKDGINLEIESNLSAINAANENLNDLKTKIINMCNEFTDNVDKLNLSLNDTKATLENSKKIQSDSAENFEKFYSVINK